MLRYLSVCLRVMEEGCSGAGLRILRYPPSLASSGPFPPHDPSPVPPHLPVPVPIPPLYIAASVNVAQFKTFHIPCLPSREGHVGVARLLLEAGADVETPDNYGQTPFFMACWKGQLLSSPHLPHVIPSRPLPLIPSPLPRVPSHISHLPQDMRTLLPCCLSMMLTRTAGQRPASPLFSK